MWNLFLYHYLEANETNLHIKNLYIVTWSYRVCISAGPDIGKRVQSAKRDMEQHSLDENAIFAPGLVSPV